MDIVAYRVITTPQTHMEVIHEPAGGAWGGTKINLEFKKFLEEVTGDEGFSQYVRTENESDNAIHEAQLNETIYETFESQKTIFGDKNMDEDGRISVQLNYTFLETYKNQVVQNLQAMRAQNDTHTSYAGSSLRITYAKLKTFYNPIVKGIIDSLEEVLNTVEIDTIYLVGGFGGCWYIYETVQGKFGDKYKYVTPEGPLYIVVKGAVMMGKNPEFLQARRVDATYGISVSIPFEEGKHEEIYRIPAKTADREDYMCSDIFATFVERGDVVNLKDVYMMTYSPERPDQEQMIVQIYSSSEKNVWYTTGKRPSHFASSTTWADVQKIGELTVPFPEAESDEDRRVDVIFDFSSAEIKVKGYDRKSQNEVKVVLDFLEV